MSYWNYRVVVRRDDDDLIYSIHETHYSDDDEIESWSVEPVFDCCALSHDELKHALVRMMECTEKDTLAESNNQLVKFSDEIVPESVLEGSGFIQLMRSVKKA